LIQGTDHVNLLVRVPRPQARAVTHTETRLWTMTGKTETTSSSRDSAAGAQHLRCAPAPSGRRRLDIAGFTKDLDVFTYDPGFGATAATESRITYSTGIRACCCIAATPIEQLAEKSSFMEVAYCCCSESCPRRSSSRSSPATSLHTMLNETLLRFSTASTTTRIHGDGVGGGGVDVGVYHDTMDIHNRATCEIFSHRIIAKLPPSPPLRTSTPSTSPFIYRATT